MKKMTPLLMAGLISTAVLTSCEKEENGSNNNNNNNNNNTEAVVEKSGEISSDQTWYADTVYILDGRVTVTGGATLTIQPGTIVKANPGTGAVSSALLISRDGKIMANGTANAPIIFTSIADDIEPGQTVSPNMDALNSGLWGGLIILGKAPISASAAEAQIEGIPTSDQNGLYGGSSPAHNSGSVTYVSIRHGGTLIGQGNEINGLTLGGVGSGTTINNIEVVANQDDGVEWFGGTVNVDNVLVWNSGDDAIDTDQDWTGRLNNFIVLNPSGHAFELDGPEGSSVSGNNHTITNGTIYMGEGDQLIDFDDDSNLDMSDIYFYGLSAGHTVSGYTGFAAASQGSVAGIEVTLDNLALTDVFPGMPSAIITIVSENQNTVGPISSAGFEWTWASQSGALANVGL